MTTGPRVLLMDPPFERLQGRFRGHLPLGLAALAGALKEAGIPAAIYNAEAPRRRGEARNLRQSELCAGHDEYIKALTTADHPVWKEAEDVFCTTNPSVVGFTVMTEKFESARILSRLVKKRLPRAFVVWGGPHPTIRPAECVAVPEVDFAVKGEGERTIVELAQRLLDGGSCAGIPGVFTRNGGGVTGIERPLEPELDRLPSPDWEAGLSPLDWPARGHGRQQIMASRGCPFRCEYCAAAAMWGRKVRFHSTARILKEIETLVRLTGSRRIAFLDDSFTLNPKRTEELCHALMASGLGIRWTCITRCDLVDEPLLRLLKRAGCQGLVFGVESASPAILESVDKGQKIEDVDCAMAACRKVGLTYHAYYMIGFPDETESDLTMTVEHMKRCGAGYVSLNVFSPYPGSALYDRVVKMGLIPDPPEWGRYGRHTMDHPLTRHITPERFRALAENAFREADRVNHALPKRIRALAARLLGR